MSLHSKTRPLAAPGDPAPCSIVCTNRPPRRFEHIACLFRRAHGMRTQFCTSDDATTRRDSPSFVQIGLCRVGHNACRFRPLDRYVSAVLHRGSCPSRARGDKNSYGRGGVQRRSSQRLQPSRSSVIGGRVAKRRCGLERRQDLQCRPAEITRCVCGATWRVGAGSRDFLAVVAQ